jgi:cytochrome P460
MRLLLPPAPGFGETLRYPRNSIPVNAMIDKAAGCFRVGIFAIAALSAWMASAPTAAAQTGTAPQYTADGRLLAPAGYQTWVFVGSNLGLAYRQNLPARTGAESRKADPPQFHNVYINPEAYAHFLATGEFPDPTILVMDRFVAADKEPRGIVANGVFNGDRGGLEVAVKNLSRPDGKTTPWAYYDFTDPSDPTKTRASAPAFADEICESCHRQHASKDNVWVQFYPVLRSLLK